jgi:hypothetical protein
MLKQFLPVVLAAGLMSVAAPFAGAQSNDSQAAPPASAQQPANGGRHHATPDPAARTRKLTKKLKLTSDQQGKVQDILQSQKSQIDSLRQENSGSQQDRRSKMMEIRQTSNTQIRALLDSDQQKKWDAMQAKRERHGHGHDSAQQAPPA